MTIDAELNLREEMTLKDVYGNPHVLTKHQVDVMIGVAWSCFICSWLANLAYYKFHPSSVEVFNLNDKWIVYVFGKKHSLGEKNVKSPDDVEGEIQYFYDEVLILDHFSRRNEATHYRLHRGQHRRYGW